MTKAAAAMSYNTGQHCPFPSAAFRRWWRERLVLVVPLNDNCFANPASFDRKSGERLRRHDISVLELTRTWLAASVPILGEPGMFIYGLIVIAVGALGGLMLAPPVYILQGGLHPFSHLHAALGPIGLLILIDAVLMTGTSSATQWPLRLMSRMPE